MELNKNHTSTYSTIINVPSNLLPTTSLKEKKYTKPWAINFSSEPINNVQIITAKWNKNTLMLTESFPTYHHISNPKTTENGNKVKEKTIMNARDKFHQ